jgi:hypothetical protein
VLTPAKLVGYGCNRLTILRPNMFFNEFLKTVNSRSAK